MVTPTPRPTPTPEPRSLPTGTIIYNSNAANGNSGHGELAVKNYLGYDAIFIMTRQSTPKVPAFGVYIGRYNNYKIAGIPDGSYILYYMYGTDWDGDAKKFTNLVSSRRFDEVLNYTTTYSSDSYTYDTYTVTLNPLGGGKAITTYVYYSDFPR